MAGEKISICYSMRIYHIYTKIRAHVFPYSCIKMFWSVQQYHLERTRCYLLCYSVVLWIANDKNDSKRDGKNLQKYAKKGISGRLHSATGLPLRGKYDCEIVKSFWVTVLLEKPTKHANKPLKFKCEQVTWWSFFKYGCNSLNSTSSN